MASAWTKSSTAVRTKKAERPKIRMVEVEGAVVLKIIKHCSQHSRTKPVTGQLLGLDTVSPEDAAPCLEVTNSFPLPLAADDDAGARRQYQMQMLTKLREVNVDCNVVGWYQSTFMGYTHLAEQSIKIQAFHQDKLRCAVCLVYDPMRSTPSAISLKAYRLTDAFMKLQADKFQTKSAAAPSMPIFEQLPVRIKNSYLVQGLLLELQKARDSADLDFTGIEQAHGRGYVERSIENMIECVDEISNEQRRAEMYRRDRSRQANKEAFPELSRLDAMLQSNQIGSYCSQISQYSGQSMSKLYLMQNLSTKR